MWSVWDVCGLSAAVLIALATGMCVVLHAEAVRVIGDHGRVKVVQMCRIKRVGRRLLRLVLVIVSLKSDLYELNGTASNVSIG